MQNVLFQFGQLKINEIKTKEQVEKITGFTFNSAVIFYN